MLNNNDRILMAPEGSFYAMCEPRIPRKRVLCLRCRKEFLSMGKGNRLCGNCRPGRHQEDYERRKTRGRTAI